MATPDAARAPAGGRAYKVTSCLCTFIPFPSFPRWTDVLQPPPLLSLLSPPRQHVLPHKEPTAAEEASSTARGAAESAKETGHRISGKREPTRWGAWPSLG